MAAWWAQQAGKGTAEELVHLLAFAVRYEAEGTMAVLLEPRRPPGGTLPMSSPVWGAGGGAQLLAKSLSLYFCSFFVLLLRF